MDKGELKPTFSDLLPVSVALEKAERQATRASEGQEPQPERRMVTQQDYDDTLAAAKARMAELKKKEGADKYGITKAKIIFIDSDTYSSSKEALTFCGPTVQEGTFVILDDYYSYKSSFARGVTRAFAEFLVEFNCEARHVLTYGMGGVVYVLNKVGGSK